MNHIPRIHPTDSLPFIRLQWQRRPIPCQIFLALCFNLLLAPAVLAATGGTISRINAYAIAALGLVTVGLAIYLILVMLQPQRF